MTERNERRPHRESTGILRAVSGALAVVLLLAVVGLVVVYSGAYNVAATEDHVSLVRWAFDTTFHNSVARRAPEPPERGAPGPDALAAGARAYRSTCQHCHAGPGVERSAWTSGMRPRPPHLAEAATHWKLGEVFWIAKHGVKMTGMPAFGPTQDDRTLWRIAAFVKRLPALTPEEYKALGAEDEHAGDAGGASARDEGKARP